jgi:phage terminase large subunit-like protein
VLGTHRMDEHPCMESLRRPHASSLEQFAGAEAFFILDLASKDDVAAFIILLRKKIKGEWHYYIFARYYHTGEGNRGCPVPNQVAYRKWKIEGFLTTTDANDGTEIDFDTISRTSCRSLAVASSRSKRFCMTRGAQRSLHRR